MSPNAVTFFTPMIHGDPKGVRDYHQLFSITALALFRSSILVGVARHAQVTDFDPAVATRDLDSIRSVSEDQSHTARWTTPEILNEQGACRDGADAFSFAMVTVVDG